MRIYVFKKFAKSDLVYKWILNKILKSIRFIIFYSEDDENQMCIILLEHIVFPWVNVFGAQNKIIITDNKICLYQWLRFKMNNNTFFNYVY